MELRPGDVLLHPSGALIEIRILTEGPESVLAFDVSLPPGAGLLPEHAHAGQVETFRITAGEASLSVAGAGQRARAGEEVVVPADTPHVNPWNDGAAALAFRQSVSPVLEFPAVFERLGFRRG